MCGIAGVIYRDGASADPEVVRSMARTLAHRGPDGEGVHVFPGGGFGHRRLAILDLSADGAQPMGSADGMVWVVFNGEIYNFTELRTQLEAHGHRFHSRTDTEVIIEAWRAWGEQFVGKLDGMFAFALWDKRTRQLLLARDRTGKKPLYVYEDGKKLVFGSEIKAILSHPELNTREWPEAAAQFLSHGYVPTPHTFYANIRKVKPSTYELLEFGQRETRENQYWDFPLGKERRVESEDDWREVEHDVRRLFFAAVKRRMMSDVPIGAFLSGGVDSSLVVAAMAHHSSRPVKTFSIGFEGAPKHDETGFARMVAQRYGTEHTEFKIKPDAFDLGTRLAWHFDEPFGDSSALPTYIVSKLTREAGCTVALTGDGGDEVFAGYNRFIAVAAAERVPAPARRIIGAVVRSTKERLGTANFAWRAHRFASRATHELPDRLRSWVMYFSPAEVRDRLGNSKSAYVSESALSERYWALFRFASRSGSDVLNQVLYANARTYLLDDLNVKVDRASMAAGLECRAPFLDTALMEYAFSLPSHTKISGLETKVILRRACRDLLVPSAANRPKMGFGVPLSRWNVKLDGVEGRPMEAWAANELSRWMTR